MILTPTAPVIDDIQLEAGFDDIIKRRSTVGLALGVVRNGQLELFRGHGVADIAWGTPITRDTTFRIASITKTFTAIAVLQLVEQGLVDLHAPASEYLRAYRLVPAKPSHRPASVRDLLTHTAGVPEVVRPWAALQPDFGESVKAGQKLPSLRAFYDGSLRLAAEPGTMFRYGNHGIATLGQIVEDMSGLPLERYFRNNIFEPLGMADTDLLRSARVRSRLATGYEFGARGPRPVAERDMVTAAAASIYSTPADMALYLAALLGGGANEHGRVLKPDTLASMFAAQYQPDPRLPGLGLAFFRRDLDGHLAVEHQGTLPGFHSQIFLAPDEAVGVMAFTNGAWQPDFWLPAECERMLRRIVGLPADEVRTDVQAHPEIWGDLCGWYRLPGPLTDIRIRAFAGAGAEVFVRDGQPMLRFLTIVPALYRGFPLLPDDANDPFVFRIELPEFGMGFMRVVFGRTPGVGTTSVSLDGMPVTMHKQPARTNPRLWAMGGLYGLGLAAAAVTVRRRIRGD